MMPTGTLIIKDKVVTVELESMERQIKRRIEDIGGKNIQLVKLQQIVEADWPEVDMDRMGFFYKRKQSIGTTEYVQIVGDDDRLEVSAESLQGRSIFDERVVFSSASGIDFNQYLLLRVL